MLDQQTPIVDAATLAAIVAFVWQTFVDPDAALVPCPPGGPADVDHPCATISIGGRATATLVVAMPPELVARFAGALLGCAPDELEPADADDAFGELVNVVGGNVKGLVDDPTAMLSLPVVSPSRASITGGRLTVRLTLDAGGQTMVWELWERV